MMYVNPRTEPSGAICGYTMLLSRRDTRAWADRPNSQWPYAALAGHRVHVGVDRNGLASLMIDDHRAACPAPELAAIVADHLPSQCRHLWPAWEGGDAC